MLPSPRLATVFIVAPNEAIDVSARPCDTCLALKQPHRVSRSVSVVQVEGTPDYYDEKMDLHTHSFRQEVHSLNCSNGHERAEIYIVKCPSCGWTLDQEA